MTYSMRKNVKLWILLAVVVAVVLLVILWTIEYPIHHPILKMMESRQRHPPPWDIELFYTFKTILSTVNVTLLLFLLVSYLDIYRKIKSEFTIGLIVFSLTLLFYALSSNPLVHWLFGFRGFGLGPFAMLPDLFTTVALTVLLYFTFKY